MNKTINLRQSASFIAEHEGKQIEFKQGDIEELRVDRSIIEAAKTLSNKPSTRTIRGRKARSMGMDRRLISVDPKTFWFFEVLKRVNSENRRQTISTGIASLVEHYILGKTIDGSLDKLKVVFLAANENDFDELIHVYVPDITYSEIDLFRCLLLGCLDESWLLPDERVLIDTLISSVKIEKHQRIKFLNEDGSINEERKLENDIPQTLISEDLNSEIKNTKFDFASIVKDTKNEFDALQKLMPLWINGHLKSSSADNDVNSRKTEGEKYREIFEEERYTKTSLGLGRYLDTRRSRFGPGGLNGRVMQDIMESLEKEYSPLDIQKAIRENIKLEYWWARMNDIEQIYHVTEEGAKDIQYRFDLIKDIVDKKGKYIN